MFNLYILYSNILNSYYVGVSANVEERLKKHLSNHKGYTAKVKDWTVVYIETFQTKSEALKREKQIKTGKAKL
ncbi:GIY-YIG nuclease family protein [Chryseobacterium sp. MP_3.2]|uniref:GIY-YIG nuclease family protein n=1 Tax=Chryseobacterium sp. MP_3.2 TaxID=3071712 RepID=UPI002DFD6FD3|nr:putative endonuclease [Chryseobacterium sp. MP_3.2]MEC5158876.1 putative endonuclease [Chryseobacterium sp. MP_3.2]